MTKSVKEKQRLQSIKNYEKSGLGLVADMLKVRVVYKSHKFSRKEPDNYISESLLKEQIHSFLKSRIKDCLLPIANIINVYEFKLIVSVFLYTDDSHNQITKLFMQLSDKNNISIGSFSFNGNQLSNSLINTSPEYYLINSGNKRSLEISHIKNLMTAFDEQSSQIELSIFNNYKTKNIIIEKIRNDFKNHERYYWRSKKILRTPSLNIVVNQSIKYFIYARFSTKQKRPNKDLKLATSYNDIDYILFLIDAGLFELNIDKSQLTMENIEEIKNTIKIMYY